MSFCEFYVIITTKLEGRKHEIVLDSVTFGLKYTPQTTVSVV